MHGYDENTIRNNYTSKALEKAAVVQDATFLEGFTVFSTNGSTQYVWLFDLAGVPASGQAGGMPVAAVGTLGSVSLDWVKPRIMNTGIVLANSSSASTFTAGSADCWFDVQYAVRYPDA